MKATLIILAGGKSLRLGRIKALETIGGESLIERVVERLKPIADRILIVTSPEQIDFPVSGEVEIIVDLYPGRGPLGGIYTGLWYSRSPLSIIVACDMPFINADLMEYMVGISEDYDVIVPRLKNGMLEPLHAVYSRTCLNKMEIRLKKNELGVHPFLETVNVRYINQAEIQKFDPQLLSFFNINYLSDIDKANAIIAKEKN
ncbi:molybdenum cofactor guanylyltransferase [Chloroflexota bacterium]